METSQEEKSGEHRDTLIESMSINSDPYKRNGSVQT